MSIDTRHPKAGTIITLPDQGDHSKAYAAAHGIDNWETENAVDVWLYAGTPILAIANGVISPGNWGYGFSSRSEDVAGLHAHLVIGTSQFNSKGFVCFYAHLFQLLVNKGDHVSGGQTIGYTGISTGAPHLHFAVMPGFKPQDYAHLAYSLTGKRYGKGSGSGGGGGHPPPPQIEDAWHDLVSSWGKALPSAVNEVNRARSRLKDAVS